MITPVSIETNNVAKELLRIASNHRVPKSSLRVILTAITTLVKENNSDFAEINGSDITQYKDEEYLRDENIEFVQEYEVTIESMPKEYPFRDMIACIELEENNTLANLVIKEGSSLEYYDGLYEDFLGFINELKLRENVMLYLFDVDYTDTIREFVNVIKQIKKIVFKEDKKILVSKGYNEEDSVLPSVFMTLEEGSDANTEDSQGRVDYANRGFLLSCQEGDELFSFTKPKQGKHGRDCRGNLIEVEIVNPEAKPSFTVDDSIEIEDSFENIKFLSARSGYLIEKNGKYDVSNNIDVDEISFKTTGTINTDLESEISINVIKDNPLEDAIEEGMHVKVQTLNITGSIGRNTQIEVRDLSISGQSHNESTIKCVEAEINVHKGKVTARNVEVTRLEGGEIIADTVTIKHAVSGKIKAKTIKIETLGSYVTMEALELIEIDLVKGEENRFIIDSLFSSPFDRSRQDDQNYLNETKSELQALVKTLKELTEKVKKNLEPCKKIKEVIIVNHKKGISNASSLLKQFKICKVMQVHYKKLKEDVSYKKNQYAKLEKKLSSEAYDVFESRIIINEPLQGFNYILFKLNNPKVEVELRTNESMSKKVFKLSRDDEDVLEVINLNQ